MRPLNSPGMSLGSSTRRRAVGLALRAGLALAAAVALSACATTRPTTGRPVDPAPVEEVQLDPSLIKATVSDGQVNGTKVINSSEVFAQAQEAFSKRRYEEAVKHYAVIIEHFADSDYALASFYNSGLAFDHLQRHEDAARMYRQVYERFRGYSEATDALFRLAGSLARLERHDEVLEVTDLIDERMGLKLPDRVESLVRRGDALLAKGQLNEAETRYREAMTLNRRASAETALPDDAFFLVSAQYGIARVYHELFRAIKFRLPVERMEQDLEDKVKIFQQAQGLYIRAIRLGHPYWATASRYQIARMYEDFYSDLLTSEIPRLTDEEAEIYFEALRENLRPLMESALQYYEKTIILSERQGVDNEYTQRTQEALERLKVYMTDPRLQDREEDAIRTGTAPEGLGIVPQDTRPEPLDEQK